MQVFYQVFQTKGSPSEFVLYKFAMDQYTMPPTRVCTITPQAGYVSALVMGGKYGNFSVISGGTIYALSYPIGSGSSCEVVYKLTLSSTSGGFVALDELLYGLTVDNNLSILDPSTGTYI